MASKAKSGMSAVRMFPENILQPPNTFVGGATSFTSAVRDGKGHASLHVGVVNATAFTLKILHSWRSTGPFTLDQSIASVVDTETGNAVAEVIVPVTKRFVKIVVDAPAPGLSGAVFEIGAYFLPRTPVASIIVSGSGGGGTVTAVKGSPGTVVGPTPADTVVGVGATVALPAIPSGTRRMNVQNVGATAGTILRLREVGAGAGRGEKLLQYASRMYGGADGALAALEVEEVSGIATLVTVIYERD